jgi:Flp pilus assembly protein TadD
VYKQIIPQIIISLLLGGIGLIPQNLSAEAQNSVKVATRLNSQQRQELYNLLQQGKQYITTGDLNNALSIYRQAATLDTDNAKIFSSMGYLYASLGDYSAATNAYQQAISLAPDNGDFYTALGFSFAQTGDNTNAINAYRRAVALQPQNPDNLIALGFYC